MPFVFCLDSFCPVYAVNSSFFNPFTSFVTFLFVSLRLNKLLKGCMFLWVIPSMSRSLSPALPSSILFIYLFFFFFFFLLLLFYAVIYFKLSICICCML